MKTKNKKSSAPVAASARRELLALVRQLGEDAVLAVLGTRRDTLARALAGLNVHAGTRAAVEAALAKLAAERGAA